MNKLTSGILAIGIYLGLIFLILLYYNKHQAKAKHYVEKNSNRVTVTLVNSDKTIFNKNSKISIPKKPTKVQHHNIKSSKSPIHHNIPNNIPKIKKNKKSIVPTKKDIERKKLAQERLKRVQQEQLEAKKRKEAQKEAQRLARIKKEKEKKERIKKEQEAKRLARIKKEQEEQRIKKEREERRLAQIKAQEERKKRAKNLFSSISTNSDTTPKKTPKKVREPSHIRHHSSITDRIKNTHQSGTVSNRNRDKGIVNAYIAKVEKQLENWNAQSSYKGQKATIKLTIFNSGKFRYTIKRSSSGALSRGLREFLDQLNRIGLGQHNKSTPYIIEVTFIAK